jgi:hypothetical protein
MKKPCSRWRDCRAYEANENTVANEANMRANRAPKWLGRMILCDELRALGLPWSPEAVEYRPDDRWLTYGDTLQAVDVSAAIVARMRRRIPVGDDLRAAAWRCTVAGLQRLPREAWPTDRQHAGDSGKQPDVVDECHEVERPVERRSVPISITWRNCRHG